MKSIWITTLVFACACGKGDNNGVGKSTPNTTGAAHDAASAPQNNGEPESNAGAMPTVTLSMTASDKLGSIPAGIGLAKGQSAPLGIAKGLDGQEVNLDQWIGKTKTMIVFYRGGWCPYCNLQIAELTKHADDFAKAGYSIIAVSVDKPESASSSKEAHTIPFPILSDAELKLHRSYQVMTKVPDDKFEQLKEMGIDLEAASGADHHTIAIPAIFLIDESGKIQWSHADVDYTTRPSAEQLLETIQSL